MSFRVLSAQGADVDAWRALLARLPPHRRDLHYLPEYGLVYADTYGYEPLLAVWEREDELVLHAFVRRALDALPCIATSNAHERYTDAATPYGYGGPLVGDETSAGRTLRAFDAAYRNWCSTERIAAEFVCLHPLLANHEPLIACGVAAARATKEVVVIDLSLPEDALWSQVSRGTRSSIQRARREGVVIEQVEPDDAALATFRGLYVETMRRRGAAARWFFPETYFSACVHRLGTRGSALFFARCEGEVAAAYLILNDTHTAYYHFGASEARWLALRPNNLLMYETVLWAKRRGLVRYHLGGGVSSGETDSLLRFKSSFGGSRALLYTYGRVLNEDVYRHLCALKVEHERSAREPIADPDYFPLYRR